MRFTPYSFITSVLFRLHITLAQKQVKAFLHSSKLLLEKLRSFGFDDNEILQMIDYTCNGMLKQGMPRDFRYFAAIMQGFASGYMVTGQSETASAIYKNWIAKEIEKRKTKAA